MSKEALLALGPDCTVAEVVQLIMALTKESEELVFQRLAKFINSKLYVDAKVFRESKLVSDLHFGQWD